MLKQKIYGETKAISSHLFFILTPSQNIFASLGRVCYIKKTVYPNILIEMHILSRPQAGGQHKAHFTAIAANTRKKIRFTAVSSQGFPAMQIHSAKHTKQLVKTLVYCFVLGYYLQSIIFTRNYSFFEHQYKYSGDPYGQYA